VCKSIAKRTGTMSVSNIRAWHFGQAGRSIATSGMMDDRDRSGRR
jgi:hypothetical protein